MRAIVAFLLLAVTRINVAIIQDDEVVASLALYSMNNTLESERMMIVKDRSKYAPPNLIILQMAFPSATVEGWYAGVLYRMEDVTPECRRIGPAIAVRDQSGEVRPRLLFLVQRKNHYSTAGAIRQDVLLNLELENGILNRTVLFYAVEPANLKLLQSLLQLTPQLTHFACGVILEPSLKPDDILNVSFIRSAQTKGKDTLTPVRIVSDLDPLSLWTEWKKPLRKSRAVSNHSSFTMETDNTLMNNTFVLRLNDSFGSPDLKEILKNGYDESVDNRPFYQTGSEVDWANDTFLSVLNYPLDAATWDEASGNASFGSSFNRSYQWTQNYTVTSTHNYSFGAGTLDEGLGNGSFGSALDRSFSQAQIKESPVNHTYTLVQNYLGGAVTQDGAVGNGSFGSEFNDSNYLSQSTVDLNIFRSTDQNKVLRNSTFGSVFSGSSKLTALERHLTHHKFLLILNDTIVLNNLEVFLRNGTFVSVFNRSFYLTESEGTPINRAFVSTDLEEVLRDSKLALAFNNSFYLSGSDGGPLNQTIVLVLNSPFVGDNVSRHDTFTPTINRSSDLATSGRDPINNTFILVLNHPLISGILEAALRNGTFQSVFNASFYLTESQGTQINHPYVSLDLEELLKNNTSGSVVNGSPILNESETYRIKRAIVSELNNFSTETEQYKTLSENRALQISSPSNVPIEPQHTSLPNPSNWSTETDQAQIDDAITSVGDPLNVPAEPKDFPITTRTVLNGSDGAQIKNTTTLNLSTKLEEASTKGTAVTAPYIVSSDAEEATKEHKSTSIAESSTSPTETEAAPAKDTTASSTKPSTLSTNPERSLVDSTPESVPSTLIWSTDTGAAQTESTTETVNWIDEVALENVDHTSTIRGPIVENVPFYTEEAPVKGITPSTSEPSSLSTKPDGPLIDDTTTSTSGTVILSTETKSVRTEGTPESGVEPSTRPTIPNDIPTTSATESTSPDGALIENLTASTLQTELKEASTKGTAVTAPYIVPSEADEVTKEHKRSSIAESSTSPTQTEAAPAKDTTASFTKPSTLSTNPERSLVDSTPESVPSTLIWSTDTGAAQTESTTGTVNWIHAMALENVDHTWTIRGPIVENVPFYTEEAPVKGITPSTSEPSSLSTKPDGPLINDTTTSTFGISIFSTETKAGRTESTTESVADPSTRPTKSKDIPTTRAAESTYIFRAPIGNLTAPILPTELKEASTKGTAVTAPYTVPSDTDVAMKEHKSASITESSTSPTETKAALPTSSSLLVTVQSTLTNPEATTKRTFPSVPDVSTVPTELNNYTSKTIQGRAQVNRCRSCNVSWRKEGRALWQQPQGRVEP